MRLVRRVLTSAAASLALGALLTGVALGAEPTTAEADADATLNLGLGADGATGLDAGLDGILGVTDGAAATDVVVDTGSGALLGTGQPTAPTGAATADVNLGAATDATTDGTADPAADANATIDLGASQASLAGAGMNAGSVVNIDLDAARADSVGASADLGSSTGDAGSASGEVAADLSIGAGTGATDASGSLVLRAGGDASDASGDASADLAFGAGTDAADASADLGIGAVLDALATGLGIVNGAVASLGLGAATDATDAADSSADLGTGAVTDVVAAGLGIVNGAVLGIQGRGLALLPGGAAVGGDEPTGRDGMAAPTAAAGPTGGSVPDTAMGTASELVFWGLLLAVLAGLTASTRRLPSRRRP